MRAVERLIEIAEVANKERVKNKERAERTGASAAQGRGFQGQPNMIPGYGYIPAYNMSGNNLAMPGYMPGFMPGANFGGFQGGVQGFPGVAPQSRGHGQHNNPEKKSGEGDEG